MGDASMSTSTILPVIHPVEGELDVDSLARLHTAIVDTAEGVDHLRGHADAAATPVLDSFRELHVRHDRELAAEMSGKGHPPSSEGAFHHLVHSGAERLRDLFDTPGDPILHQLLDNERQLLEAYNSASERGGPSDTIGLLQRQREEVGALVVKHDSRLS